MTGYFLFRRVFDSCFGFLCWRFHGWANIWVIYGQRTSYCYVKWGFFEETNDWVICDQRSKMDSRFELLCWIRVFRRKKLLGNLWSEEWGGLPLRTAMLNECVSEEHMLGWGFWEEQMDEYVVARGVSDNHFGCSWVSDHTAAILSKPFVKV